MPGYSITDSTGVLLRTVTCSASDIAANLDTGEIAVEIADGEGGMSVSSALTYIEDPEGTPVRTARPLIELEASSYLNDVIALDLPATVTVTIDGYGVFNPETELAGFAVERTGEPPDEVALSIEGFPYVPHVGTVIV